MPWLLSIQDFWRYRHSFLLVCGEQNVTKNHDSQSHLEVNLSDFVVSTVPLSTGTSADIRMTKKCVSCICIGTITCQVRFFNPVLSPDNTVSFLQIFYNLIPLNLTPRTWFGVSVILLMTLVPVQKLCVNIYVYIYVYIPYTSSVIGRIYNGSVIQYWRSCTPSRSIGECAVPDLNAILCFLWFTNCVLLFDNNLILGCLWHCVFV